MARTFDGSTSSWVGGDPADFAFGAMAVIMRLVDDGVGCFFLGHRDTPGAAQRASIMKEGVGQLLQSRWAGTVSAPTIQVTSADGWAFYGVSKASGSVAPIYYKYVYSTDTWSQETGAGAQSNANVTHDALHVAHRISDQRMGGDMLVAGVFASNVVSADKMRDLPFDLRAWVNHGATSLLVFDQNSTSTPVRDLVGPAHETSVAGSSISTTNPPVFSYGYVRPSFYESAGAVFTGGTLNSKMLIQGVGT